MAKRFKKDYIQNKDGGQIHLESFFEGLRGRKPVINQDKEDLAYIRDYGERINDRNLVNECDRMMADLMRPARSSESKDTISSADTPSSTNNYSVIEQTGMPASINSMPQIELYVKNKSRFAQLIHLTWKAGYYKYKNSFEVELNDVNAIYNQMFHEDFSALKGNVHNMYKGGNYAALYDELENVIDTQKSLLNEIKNWIGTIHNEKNP